MYVRTQCTRVPAAPAAPAAPLSQTPRIRAPTTNRHTSCDQNCLPPSPHLVLAWACFAPLHTSCVPCDARPGCYPLRLPVYHCCMTRASRSLAPSVSCWLLFPDTEPPHARSYSLIPSPCCSRPCSLIPSPCSLPSTRPSARLPANPKLSDITNEGKEKVGRHRLCGKTVWMTLAPIVGGD